MPRRVYDRRLLALLEAALGRGAAYQPGPRSQALKPIIVDVFTRGRDAVRDAVEMAADESREAGEADDALRVLAGSSDDLFGRHYHAIVGDYHARRAAGEVANPSHTEALDRFLEGHSPASYAELSPARKVVVLGEAVRLGDQFLDPRWSDLHDKATQVHAELVDALDHAQLEAGQADEAQLARDQAFETGRTHYLAGREILSAALRLDGKSELLDKWAPPVSSIRSMRTAPDPAESSDAEPEPIAPDTP